MMFTYIQSEPNLWTVGFHSPDGRWHSDSDHADRNAARKRVNYLNGGRVELELDTTLSAEAQIANVLRSLSALVTGPAHRYRMEAVRGTVAQLSEMWEQYRDGELMPIPEDGIPF